MYDLEKFEKTLKETLSSERYLHSQGVMYTAGSLAMAYDVDFQEAMIAGLLHDCGKLVTEMAQIKACERWGIALSPEELAMPALIHTKLGAVLAQEVYGVTETSIQDAIRYHTTGRPHMSLLEKIVYIADFIEPWRGSGSWVDETRKLAFVDLDKAVVKGTESKITHLKKQNKTIDKMSIKTLEYYGGISMSSIETAKNMAKITYHALEEKKGEEITIIDISTISVIADYFIIANGSNEAQVRALVESVEDALEKEGYFRKKREGTHNGGWVLLDFHDIIIHIFDKENRLFYDLERIWRDGKQIHIGDL